MRNYIRCQHPFALNLRKMRRVLFMFAIASTFFAKLCQLRSKDSIAIMKYLKTLLCQKM